MADAIQRCFAMVDVMSRDRELRTAKRQYRCCMKVLVISVPVVMVVGYLLGRM